MLVRLALVAIATCCFLVPAQAQAPSAPEPLLSGQLGVAVLALPAYPGAEDRWVIPVPLADLRIARRFYLGDGLGGLSAGAGVYLVERGGFSWSADLALTSDRPEDRTNVLAGMGDRGFGVFGGTTMAYRMGPVEASAAVAVGLEDRMGLIGVVGLNTGGPLGGRWFGQLGSVGVFGDCANLRWDFGVTGAQAARRRELVAQGAPDLGPADGNPYQPACGLREIRGTGTLGYCDRPALVAVRHGHRRALRARSRCEPPDAGADFLGGRIGSLVAAVKRSVSPWRNVSP